MIILFRKIKRFHTKIRCGLPRANNQWEKDFQLNHISDLIDNYLYLGSSNNLFKLKKQPKIKFSNFDLIIKKSITIWICYIICCRLSIGAIFCFRV